MSAPTGRKRIGLALGGGVLRGFAHIGVLDVLEQEGIPFDFLSGASVGAIVGGVYATGLALDIIKEAAATVHWPQLARPVLSAEGLVSFTALERWLEGTIGSLYFEDLALPFVAVATDMETGAAVPLATGPLAPAIRASCSVPGLVTPTRLDGRYLCDGGISNNLPVAPLRDLGADVVIGVDVFQHAPRWPLMGPLGRGLTAVEIMVEHAGGGLEKADCLITPDLSGKSYVRFGIREELITLGRAATRDKLPQIRAAIA